MKSKIIPLLGGLLLLSTVNLSAFDIKEVPLLRAGTAVIVSVSTSAWTKVNNSTSAIDRRSVYRLNNIDGNNADMGCTFAESTPTISTGTYDVELPDGANLFFQIGPNLNAYCVSLNTSAEFIRLKEYGQ